jgi:hypothetical protein
MQVFILLLSMCEFVFVWFVCLDISVSVALMMSILTRSI